MQIKSAKSIRGEIYLPGDKSIAHRSIFISAIAKSKTRIYNFPANQDCLRTVQAFRKLGVKISQGAEFYVEGRGLYGLKKPASSIFAGESGTTFRLFLGLLAGQPFQTTLTAGPGLKNRPMQRITGPLRKMGAVLRARRPAKMSKRTIQEYPPITIKKGELSAITYKMPIASAQVKSALLLAGLYAKGVTKIIEPIKTRDHSERMLKDFKADIKRRGKVISLSSAKGLISPGEIYLPADISSASFFMIAAILLPHSRLVIKSVGLNPGRMGIIRVLKRMGANIKVVISKSFHSSEPIGDIIVKSSSLKGIKIPQSIIPQLIDELPILMLAACFAKGKTIICGAGELRVKETDRIISMQTNLRNMGANISVLSRSSKAKNIIEERIIIQGGRKLRNANVSSFNDHRTAMAMVIAGLLIKGGVFIDDVGCIAKSFPDFLKVLGRVVRYCN
ncbi:MAG: 3-phosphoshikimate 1-carboxyvinyltransferase [Candidatus Omnitrophota bacterium]